MRERSPSDTAVSSFPLNDIDYESSPAAVAQELSNLQALRRMSMDVAATGDPDLPSLSPAAVPGLAPSASDSEDDSSRLFWVPARLHPELAPQEFKSFLNSKAEQIRRRSGELSSFSSQSSSAGSLSSLDSGVGLRRKKSMLSRQIDNSNGRAADGYQDGAERLERKKSMSKRSGSVNPNLEELESLVSDDAMLKRLSFEGQSPSDGGTGDIILPTVPGSNLKRSTRTTYRRGSQKGLSDRTGRRLGRGNVSGTSSPTPDMPPLPAIPAMPTISVVEPSSPAEQESTTVSESTRPRTNFSRPGRTPSPPTAAARSDSLHGQSESTPPPSNLHQQQMRQWQSQMSRSGPLTGMPSAEPERSAVPQIVETPPPPETQSLQSRPGAFPQVPPHSQSRLPERTSSREDPRTAATPQRPPGPVRQPSPVNQMRPGSRGNSRLPASQSTQGLDHMSSHPSPMPGMDNNTASLSFIPTLTEDKKADNKKIKDKKEEPRKSSWGWLLGKEEEKDKQGQSLKQKAKIVKPPEKHDSTRLDLLQTSIDGAGKGRESLVLDRESLKLEEERKKESQRKSVGSDIKKEKDGLFSSLFGGKKKAEKEVSKKHGNRGLSPDPPPRELKPDIDYNWTRFSILEERAIYRMAHIKLANPRRALYSQVLLSNFMYSYLAKVQQMHPQMNLPTSAKQQQQKKQQPPPKDQPDEFTQYQRYQKVCPQSQVCEPLLILVQQQSQQGQQARQQGQQPQYGDAQTTQPGYGSSQGQHEDDNNMYDYQDDNRRPSSRGSKHGLQNGNVYHAGGGGGGYQNQYSQPGQHQDYVQGEEDDDDDMW